MIEILKPVKEPVRSQPQHCQLEEACNNPAWTLVRAVIHSGPDGSTQSWICDDHLSALQLASPFSRLTVLKVLPK